MLSVIWIRMAAFAAAIMLVLGAAAPAGAIPLITNGGFESGFTGWTRVDATGSDGTFFWQSGTSSPVNGDPVPAPPEGSYAAMTDAGAPGAHLLYQDFFVPLTIGSAVFSADLFIGNRADAFFSPASLDFGIAEINQQARVDILRSGADPFSVAGGDVLMNLFQTMPGDPLVSGYSTTTADLTSLLVAHAGETMRLRFAETDNLFIMQMGVDGVSLETAAAPVPEPASLALLGLGLAGMGVFRRRRRASAA
jgi:hypothetical protein